MCPRTNKFETHNKHINYRCRICPRIKEFETSMNTHVNYAKIGWHNDINNQISSTGTYDGIRLKSQLVTKPLVDPVTIFSPVGDGVSLSQPLGNEMYPSIDGQPNSAKHLFTFAHNVVSPDCCGNSNISSDMGCVCYSQEQLRMFGRRDGNLTEPIEYPGI